jgi:hypothetical protein
LWQPLLFRICPYYHLRLSAWLTNVQSAYRLATIVRFQNFLRIWFYHGVAQAARRVHPKSWEWKFSQQRTRRSPSRGECKGLNLVAVRLVEFQLTRLSVQQNGGQRAMAAVNAVMCAMHIALNTLITVWLYVHKICEHINVCCRQRLRLVTKDLLGLISASRTYNYDIHKYHNITCWAQTRLEPEVQWLTDRQPYRAPFWLSIIPIGI